MGRVARMTVSGEVQVRVGWSRVFRLGRWRWLAVIAGAAVALAPAGAAVAGTPTATTAATGAAWGRAIEVPGLAALNAGGNARVLSVSCWRAGDCAAVGFYTRVMGFKQAFVVTERDFLWGKALEVPGSAALNVGGNAQVLSVSCGPGGDCEAGGFYTDHGKDTQGFLVMERDFKWGAAATVPGLAALNAGAVNSQVSSVSCAPGGGCAAGGFIGGAGFVATQQAGRWGDALVPPGLAKLNTGQNAAVTSVSCPFTGDCVAGGFYQTNEMDPDDTFPIQAFVVDQASGKWGAAQEIPGTATLNGGWYAEVTALSCSSIGNCGVGGYLQFTQFMNCDIPATRVSERAARPEQPPYDCEGSFVDTEKNGHWGAAQYPPYPSMSQVNSVSCSSAGNCSVGGFDYVPAFTEAYVLGQRNGKWGTPIEVPGMSALVTSADNAQINSVSCWSAGNCGAVGSYYDPLNGHGEVFVASESGGQWGRAEILPGTAALNLGKSAAVTSVSCTQPRDCAAGGSYTDQAGHTQAFVDGT